MLLVRFALFALSPNITVYPSILHVQGTFRLAFFQRGIVVLLRIR